VGGVNFANNVSDYFRARHCVSIPKVPTNKCCPFHSIDNLLKILTMMFRKSDEMGNFDKTKNCRNEKSIGSFLSFDECLG
jgi:hypothetical protein